MNTKTVAIVGGGFAGAKLARLLEGHLSEEWTIEVLSKENYITFNPLLPEVVGASVLPGHVVAPLRQMVRRARVRMVTVTEIDHAARELHYAGEGSGVLRYDHLVLACGQVANLQIVKGMSQYALPLKTLGDALFLRNRVIVRLEQASLQPDLDARRWLTSFVILGGGFSGVEVAGELLDFVRAARRYYPDIESEDICVHLVHSGERLLPELSPSLGKFTLDRLKADGVKVKLGARAVRVDDRAVYLDSDEILSAGTVVCTIGTAANPLLRDLELETNRGRIVVNGDMSVPGMDGLWALGDCAAVPNAESQDICPPTAQFADRQARQLAENLRAFIRGRTTAPFRHRPKGQLSAIGHNKAVAELFGLRLAGFVPWLLWRALYLMKIPTLARKCRLFLEWNWAMFFPPDIAHLGFNRTPRSKVAATATTPSAPPGKQVA
ncbi:MAG: NAD(P)/FAD-dependent oxidoreductase [Gammaproteobacteria bacterium]